MWEQETEGTHMSVGVPQTGFPQKGLAMAVPVACRFPVMKSRYQAYPCWQFCRQLNPIPLGRYAAERQLGHIICSTERFTPSTFHTTPIFFILSLSRFFWAGDFILFCLLVVWEREVELSRFCDPKPDTKRFCFLGPLWVSKNLHSGQQLVQECLQTLLADF